MQRRKVERSNVLVIDTLQRASMLATDCFAREADYEITARQWAVLYAVSQIARGSQTDIVNFTGIDRSTVFEMVRRLVKRGLLQRRRNRKDVRAYAVKLAPAGEAALKAGEAVANKVDEAVLATLSAARRQRFMGALKRIGEAISVTPSGSRRPRDMG